LPAEEAMYASVCVLKVAAETAQHDKRNAMLVEFTALQNGKGGPDALVPALFVAAKSEQRRKHGYLLLELEYVSFGSTRAKCTLRCSHAERVSFV
jgi:hypothetical protein